MTTARLSMLLAVMFISACAVNKLGDELKRADDTYAYMKIAPIQNVTGDSNVLVVLFRHAESGMELINYRTPAVEQDAFFLVPVADYTVIAFEDLNADYRYQPGEPAAIREQPQLFTEVSERAAELDPDNMPETWLHLSTAMSLPLSIDLSTQTLEAQIDSARKSYLKIVDWDYPAFSPENVQKGLWQPLSFHEETGYGLYLMEELDPDKQPLLLVHGINGSPVNFRDLASQLDDRYQLLLFQYPSGFPLDHSAYILHRAVDNFLERYPYPQLHVMAHSMGGLVSRGMLIGNSAQINARIGTFITLATPWSGHDAARMGVEWSPAVAPVWKSMVPESNYLQYIFSKPLAEPIDHHLFFSFARKRNGPAAGDDGVVSVQSQLKYQAQREARAVYGIDDNHNGILSNPCAVASIRVLLAHQPGQQLPALPTCTEQ